jgi:hypothetical protein
MDPDSDPGGQITYGSRSGFGSESEALLFNALVLMLFFLSGSILSFFYCSASVFSQIVFGFQWVCGSGSGLAKITHKIRKIEEIS